MAPTAPKFRPSCAWKGRERPQFGQNAGSLFDGFLCAFRSEPVPVLFAGRRSAGNHALPDRFAPPRGISRNTNIPASGTGTAAQGRWGWPLRRSAKWRRACRQSSFPGKRLWDSTAQLRDVAAEGARRHLRPPPAAPGLAGLFAPHRKRGIFQGCTESVALEARARSAVRSNDSDLMVRGSVPPDGEPLRDA